MFEESAPDRLLEGRCEVLTARETERLVDDPCACIESEFPHWVGVIEGADDLVRPSENHPVFYGCFDWHSAVHSHWSLVRQLRVFPEHPAKSKICDSIANRLTEENITREVEYFEEHPEFERPYGWAWLLRLAAELSLWEDQRGESWRETLAPLEVLLRDRIRNEVLADSRVNRTGTHGNSAFALTCTIDYATVTGRGELAKEATGAARRWYGDDTDLPLAYEPLGWDFFSPSLIEADLMRRVLDPAAFADWFADALPELASGRETLEPYRVRSGDDGLALHFVGLNLSRAWCLAGIGAQLDDDEHLRKVASEHARAGLAKAFPDEYAGTHWLSSYALYLLTRNDGGIAA